MDWNPLLTNDNYLDALLNEACDDASIRAVLLKAVQKYPKSTTYWHRLLEHELNLLVRSCTLHPKIVVPVIQPLTDLFESVLANVPQTCLFVLYLKFKMLTLLGTTSDSVHQQQHMDIIFEDTLQKIGTSFDSYPVWDMYLTFLQEQSTLEHDVNSQKHHEPHLASYEWQSKLEITFQRAVTQPIDGVSELWKRYDAWQHQQDSVIAGSLLAEFHPQYNKAKQIAIQRKVLYDHVVRYMLSFMPNCFWPIQLQQMHAWSAVIAFEKNQQQQQSTDVHTAVSLSFRQALCCCACFPDLWYEYYSFETNPDLRRKILQDACAFWNTLISENPNKYPAIEPLSTLQNLLYLQFEEEEQGQNISGIIGDNKGTSGSATKKRQRYIALQKLYWETHKQHRLPLLNMSVIDKLRSFFASTTSSTSTNTSAAVCNKDTKDLSNVKQHNNVAFYMQWMRMCVRQTGNCRNPVALSKAHERIFSFAYRKLGFTSSSFLLGRIEMEKYTLQNQSGLSELYKLGLNELDRQTPESTSPNTNTNNIDFTFSYLEFLFQRGDAPNVRAMFARKLDEWTISIMNNADNQWLYNILHKLWQTYLRYERLFGVPASMLRELELQYQEFCNGHDEYIRESKLQLLLPVATVLPAIAMDSLRPVGFWPFSLMLCKFGFPEGQDYFRSIGNESSNAYFRYCQERVSQPAPSNVSSIHMEPHFQYKLDGQSVLKSLLADLLPHLLRLPTHSYPLPQSADVLNIVTEFERTMMVKIPVH